MRYRLKPTKVRLKDSSTSCSNLNCKYCSDDGDDDDDDDDDDNDGDDDDDDGDDVDAVGMNRAFEDHI